MRRRVLVGITLMVGVVGSIPAPGYEPPDLADRAPFVWDQDAVWEALEETFLAARESGCGIVGAEIDGHLAAADVASRAFIGAPPSAEVFTTAEVSFFEAAARTAACPEHLGRLLAVHGSVRAAAKTASVAWDPASTAGRDRLYRLLYGGRMAVEEVLLQLPPGAAPTLVMGAEVPSAAPSAPVQGLTIHSGDLLLSRGGAPTSAFISRGNTHPGNFSHVALAHVAADGTVSIIESHIESGVGVFPVHDYLKDKKLRVMVLRLRPDLPALRDDPLLAHKAAEAALGEAMAGHIPYDFSMNAEDGSERFCSEVPLQGYRAVGHTLWSGRRPLAARGAARWLAHVGARYFDVPLPADLEYDPSLSVVAEWRDAETLFADHMDNAILDVLLEQAEAGEDLTPALHKMAAARVAKGWSWGLNQVGRKGPVPEGMDATAALRIEDLRGRHAAIHRRLLPAVDAFRREQGYTPPYWRLVAMAREST